MNNDDVTGGIISFIMTVVILGLFIWGVILLFSLGKATRPELSYSAESCAEMYAKRDKLKDVSLNNIPFQIWDCQIFQNTVTGQAIFNTANWSVEFLEYTAGENKIKVWYKHQQGTKIYEAAE